jgi:hypothetical protein
MDYRNYGASVTTNVANVPTDSTGEANSRIRDYVTNAEQFVSGLHDTISHLEKRLDTVLRSVPPSTAKAPTPTNAIAESHLGGRLNILNDTIKGAGERLVDLIQRVEI